MQQSPRPSFRTFPSLQRVFLVTPNPEDEYGLIRFKRLMVTKKEGSIYLMLLPIWQQEELRAGHRMKSQPSCPCLRSMQLSLAWEQWNQKINTDRRQKVYNFAIHSRNAWKGISFPEFISPYSSQHSKTPVPSQNSLAWRRKTPREKFDFTKSNQKANLAKDKVTQTNSPPLVSLQPLL